MSLERSAAVVGGVVIVADLLLSLSRFVTAYSAVTVLRFEAPASSKSSAAVPCVAPSSTDAGADPADPAMQEVRGSIDFGDGPTYVTWRPADLSLVVESLPRISLRDLAQTSMDCLHITGLAGVHDDKPPVLVVISNAGGRSCGTMLGHSYVLSFDGHSWKHVVDTVGSELHLRPDGPDIVEWKLQSAEEQNNLSAWRRMQRKKFPPSTRTDVIRMSGFIDP